MGGGYYDRSFAFLRHRQYWKKPRLIGVAYDFQRVATLPVKKHDVPLGCVISDKGQI
jgi:5-formyltetrahydrofolate cyclo-ligase